MIALTGASFMSLTEFSIAHSADSATLSDKARISYTATSTRCSTVTAIFMDTALISSLAASPMLNI